MTDSETTEFVSVQRSIDLPIGEAFDAWLDPALIPLWWGPEGYQTRVELLQARIGGRFRFHMTAPSGEACVMTGTYIRINRPSLLEFDVHDHCVAGIPAEVEPPARSSRVEVRFDVVDGKTRLTIAQIGLPMSYRDLALTGWGDSLARFSCIAGDRG